MTAAFLAATLLLGAVLCLVSFVQLLYLESLRLRPRDLPALEYFKEKLEAELGMKTETGVLSYSLIKHSLLLLLAIDVVVWIARGRAPSWAVAVESAAAAWLTMMLAAYFAPHTLYRRTRGAWVAGLAPLLRVLALLVRPLVASFEFLQSLVTPPGEQPGAVEPVTPAENIDALIEAGTEEGLIEEEDRKLIQSVVEFGDKTVREVMTPRPNLVAIAADVALDDLRQLVINEQYSRIPVYESTIDDVVGFVHVRDMFELDEEARAGRRVRELMRPISYVPETKRVQDLMREMQQANTHMVIVIDEYGNTAGLATMEDLVEVIVGEIRDEHEPATDVTADGEGAYIVSGSFDVARLHDLVEFRPEAETESTTIGGLASEWLGRVPAAGESVERDGLRIEVLASSSLRVEQVRVSRVPASDEKTLADPARAPGQASA